MVVAVITTTRAKRVLDFEPYVKIDLWAINPFRTVLKLGPVKALPLKSPRLRVSAAGFRVNIWGEVGADG